MGAWSALLLWHLMDINPQVDKLAIYKDFICISLKGPTLLN